VDGNVSFDTQSLHNRSIANGQIAQQQMGANLNYGSRIDDGKMATLYGQGGQVTMQEHQTNLGTNVSQNDAVSTMLGMQSMMMQNSGFQQTQMAQSQFQKGLSDLVSVGSTFADNKNWTDTTGSSESSQAQKSFSNAMKTATDFADNNQIGLDKSVQILTKAGIDAGVGIGKGGIFGSLGANLGAQGQWTTDARDHELLSKAKSSNIGKDFAENLSSGLQYVEDHKGSVGNSSQLQKLDQAQSSFNQSKSSSYQASATMGYSKQLSQQASEQRQRSMSANSNINDDVLRYVADKRFGGDQTAAAQWQVQNSKGYQQEAGHFLQDRQQGIKMGGMASPQSINQHHRDSQNRIEKISPQSDKIEQRISTGSNHLNRQENSFNNKMFNEAIKTQHGLKKHDDKISTSKEEIQKLREEKEKKFEESKQEGLTKKVGKKFIGIGEN